MKFNCAKLILREYYNKIEYLPILLISKLFLPKVRIQLYLFGECIVPVY